MRNGHQVKKRFMNHYQVLGPFNSGTVLMSRYLQNLFRNFAPKHFEYWKHSLPPWWFMQGHPPGPAVNKPVTDFPGVMFVCMVRSPYFWLSSTCRRPYDITFQSKSFDLGKRLRCPVSLRLQRFRNIVQLWNNYYRRYEEELEVNQRIVYVRLEDLVRNPADTLSRLEPRLERRQGSELEPVIKRLTAAPMKPQNTYGAAWEEKNRLGHLRKTISNRDLTFITQQLDRRLMQKFDYPLIWSPPDIH